MEERKSSSKRNNSFTIAALLSEERPVTPERDSCLETRPKEDPHPIPYPYFTPFTGQLSMSINRHFYSNPSLAMMGYRPSFYPLFMGPAESIQTRRSIGSSYPLNHCGNEAHFVDQPIASLMPENSVQKPPTNEKYENLSRNSDVQKSENQPQVAYCEQNKENISPENVSSSSMATSSRGMRTRSHVGSHGPHGSVKPKQAPISKRKRTVFSVEQLQKLEEAFSKSHYPTADERNKLAQEFDIKAESIKIWFQNRRTRKKKNENKKEEQNNSDHDSNRNHSSFERLKKLATSSSYR